MSVFEYRAEIIAQFPEIIGGIVLASGVQNRETPADAVALYLAEQQAILKRGEGALSEIPALAGWRRAFRKFGVDPTKYRSAPESLLRRLTKKGDIPSINLLVDFGNLVSIRYALPIAVIDRRALTGLLAVHFATGNERYTEPSQNEADPPKAGEVVFTDETNMVMARRWCWRQSLESAASLTTSEALITIEAQHESGRTDVEHAVRDLIDLLRQYAGGEFQYAILDAQRRSF